MNQILVRKKSERVTLSEVKGLSIYWKTKILRFSQNDKLGTGLIPGVALPVSVFHATGIRIHSSFQAKPLL